MPSAKRQRQRERQQAKREAAMRAQKRAQQRRQALGLVALVAVILTIAFVISRRGDDRDEENVAAGTTSTTEATPVGSAECPAEDHSATRQTAFDGPPKNCLDDGVDYTAVVTTDIGEIEVDLLEEEAPKTVNNFVFLARYNYFDGVPFHRVIPDFVVQGGDAENQDGTGGPGYTFADELPEPEDYGEGSLAMANSGANTNGSQFFIVVSEAGAKTLVEAVGGEAKYSLFGTVTSGMETVKAIERDGTTAGTPTVTHSITDVTIVEK